MIRSPYRAPAYALFFVLTTLVASLSGGLLIRFGANEDPFLMSRLGFYLAIYFGLVLAFAFLAEFMLRRERRVFVFATFLFSLLAATSLYVADWAVSYVVPGWPLSGLRAVHPPPSEGASNSWGQLDKERSLRPKRGVYRIAFIGDSFLEKPAPINLAVENALGRPDVEIINLGISGTAPDEYFYRLKNVALDLGIRHCVMFIYAGNDFVQTSTLLTIGGIVAVYPRDSFAREIGLESLNHVLTLPFRKYRLGRANEARFEADMDLRNRIRSAKSDQDLAEVLAGLVRWKARPAVIEKLLRPEAKILLDALRNPDEGRFERGYLNMATRYGSGRGRPRPLSGKFAYHWVEQSAKLCRDHGVGFTLVVIPEAAQVDPRFREIYLPLTDLKSDLAPTQEASQRLILRAQADGINTLDLFPVLDGIPGTYLDMDGHWSTKGLEIVSAAVTKKVGQRIAELRKRRK